MGIVIREISPPIKLSGLSSLTIQFNYNEAIINTLKGIGGCIYHKKLQLWEAPISSLAQICDNLTFLDDLTLTLLNTLPSSLNAPEALQNAPQRELTATELEQFRFTPFKHQIEGINFLLAKKKSLLLDSMGLGKSLQLMYFAETLHMRGLINHCLIVCGVDSLRSNWKSEIQKFSKESVLVLGEKINKNGKTVYESIPKRIEKLKSELSEFFVIVNIATLRDDKIIDAILKGPNKFGMIAVDEIHRIATKSSQQGSNLLKLKSEYQVAVTGTPITNSPLSVYIPLSWTDNDHATLTSYKSQYCIVGGFHDSAIIGYKNLEVLKEELDSCSIRRTFDQVRGNMPTKTVAYEIVEMSDEHQKFYDAIKNGIKEEADKIELNSNNLLALATRLRQATAAPSVLTSQSIDSTKLERAVELAEELLEAGEKVVMFCNFIESANKLAEALIKYRPVICTGNQTDDYMRDGVDKFRNSGDFNLLIGTHSKMGTGFSMPECHYMIMLDTPFTYSQFSQSCDRIYRITSDQPVYIKVLVCKDTFDERVREIIETKRDLSDFLVDGKVNESFTSALKNAILSL